MVHTSEATRLPIKFEKAEVFLRLKSASSPWPIASCNKMPGQPPARTMGITPAGASMALKLRCLTGRFLRVASIAVLLPIKGEADSATATKGADLPTPAVFRNAGHIQSGERLDIVDHQTICRRDNDPFVSVVKDAITFLMRGSYRRASASMRFNSSTRSEVATSSSSVFTG